MKSFWETIGGVCVINLEHRQDRWQELAAELAPMVPAEKLQRINAVWGKKLPGYRKHRLFKGCNEEESLFWAGRAGCALSHAASVRHAQQQGWPCVMILEDDACFLDNLQGEVGQMLARAMQQPWDMLFPGMEPYDDQGVLLDECQLEGTGEVVKLYRILGPLNAHCYVLHERDYEPYLAALPQGDADVWSWLAMHLSYDSWIANEYGRRADVRVLGLYPIVCVQRDSYSDIEHVCRSSDRGALGAGAFPITAVSEEDFQGRFRALAFLRRKWGKIVMHYALGCFYYMVGFRKFKVSVAKAGYWGALKAAWHDVRNRQKEGK